MPPIGHFILHSHVLPQVTAGNYTLRTAQGGLPFPVGTETTHVRVSAPRYVMPTDQILSTFPPANAEGAFSDRLPQIVLKRRTLPWERNPAGGHEVSAQPWLALVLVAEGEASLSTPTPVADYVTKDKALPDANDQDVAQGLYLSVTASVVKKIFPCAEDLAMLTHVREVDISDTELMGADDDGWVAVVLANRLPVMEQTDGTPVPVRYMACLVNVEGQLAALPKPGLSVADFAFSRAQDWRPLMQLPLPGGPDDLVMPRAALPAGIQVPGAPRVSRAERAARAAAPVVSNAAFHALDGSRPLGQQAAAAPWAQATHQVTMAARDPAAMTRVREVMANGFRPPIEFYAREKVLKFPVLAHWTFTSTEGATFETLMQSLDTGLLGTLPPEPDELAGDTAPAPRRAPPEVVATGHLGLDHQSRRGDALRAWYRGPCVPFATDRGAASGKTTLPLAHAADQLRSVVPDGREDLGLAAAFELGRLLALSQLSVVSSLQRFRAEQFGVGRVRSLLDQALPFDLPELLATVGQRRIDLGRFVALTMVKTMADNTEPMLGPQRPLADPGRPLAMSTAELDQRVANGLGLDLGALGKRSAMLGVTGALQASPVVLAPPLKAGVDLPSLRAGLMTELQRTVSQVIKQVPKRTTAATLATNADALDQLMARAIDDSTED